MKMVGRFHEMLYLSAKYSRSRLMGKHHAKDVLGNLFKGPIIPLGLLVEYHTITAKDQSRIHQFGRKVLPGLFLGYALYARGLWKGDVLVADLEELDIMDASEIYSKRLNAKEVIFPKEKGEIMFPAADGRIIDVSRTTHTKLDVKQEKRIDDYCNIDGSRDSTDPWTGFTQFTLLEEKLPDGFLRSGERLTRRR